MAPHREPRSLYASAEAVLTDDITCRVRVILQRGLYFSHAFDYLGKVISSLPPGSTTDLAQKALRCADDLECERSPLSPCLLRHLARVLIHDITTAFDITTLDSYQVRQAVLNRLCDLRHLQVYYNLQYFHENFNIFLTFQRLQSLANLRQVYLSQWCSDEIAHLLGKSCPDLQLIDAQSSFALTDSGVSSLIQCQSLKVLLIYSTSISDTGYRTLLENLPLLRKIGPCSRLNFIVSQVKNNLSLREYESCELPDDNVFSKCPHLASVHLYGTQPKKEGSTPKLPHQVTRLKLQATSGNYFNQLITPSIVHLDLQEYPEPVTTENMTRIANVCVNLRVLRLNQLNNPCRLVTKNKETFVFGHLEVLEIRESVLALDILNVSPRIRQVLIQAQSSLSPFLIQSSPTFWTGAVLQNLMTKNSLQCLESFVLCTRCQFSLETLFDFIQACPQLRSLGQVQTWCSGQKWETQIPRIYSFLREHNLAVELIP